MLERMGGDPVVSKRLALCRFVSAGLKPKCVCMIIVALFVSAANVVQSQVDITERVRRNTPLEQNIRSFCESHCQGNRREGHLTAVTVRPIGNGRYRGAMTAELRNWQEAGDPFNVTVYDWVIQVRTEGLLDSNTCIVIIDSVTVDNDIYGIFADILADQRGKKYQIANCRRLLP